MRKLSLLVLAALAVPCAASAQIDRLRLGRRLQLTERAWDARGLEAGKPISMPAFETAVRSFFLGNYRDAARALDHARFELEHDRAPSAREVARLTLDLVPRVRFLATDARRFEAALQPFYETADGVADFAALRIGLVSPSGEPLRTQTAAAEMHFSAPASGWCEGDHALVLVDEQGHELCRTTISFAKDLSQRLAALERAAASKRGIAARTIRLGVQRLRDASEGAVCELELRGAAELAKLEALAGELERCAAPFEGAGDWWLDLARDAEPPRRARFYAPARTRQASKALGSSAEATAEAGEKPLPLVVALHGMGGSEHIFFEASGAGRIVALAKQRGWLLVAPEVSGAIDLVERTIDAVAEIRCVDRKRVFLVGHSMGAMRAGAAAERDPSRYLAVALFGGAGRVHDAAKLAGIGFWIGVGTRDFARRGAVAYARALELAGHPHVVLRELDGVEHYTVLQLGLDEAFAYFDRRARGDG